MSQSGKTGRRKIAPRPAALLESMRAIGYSLSTAVADLIDNSVTANARKIELLADTDSEFPTIGILDDGTGMTEPELMEAMRHGSRSPLDDRAATDLGRFGLGLKTASFSQCRRLTVLTRKNGATSCAVWDLDTVADSDEWFVETPDDHGSIPWSDHLTTDGTLVVWEKLDRLVDPNIGNRQDLLRQIDNMASHLECVFHRYMSLPGKKRISMSLNGQPLEPFDPFHLQNPATQLGQEETFLFREQRIEIQPVTLPHHDKVSAADWEKYSRPEGYLRNQGFYLYRNMRLIVRGGWFGLMRQKEITKLSRVRVDIPNSMDADWKIDVRKASAHPPPPVRDRLRRLVDRIGSSSKRVYVDRGKRLVSDNKLPVWTRTQDKNRISYGLNLNHPAFAGFMKELAPPTEREFRKLINLVVSTLPIDALFSDMAETPENVAAPTLDEKGFIDIARFTYKTLRAGGNSREDVEKMMQSAEPFRSNWQTTKQVIDTLEHEGRKG